MVTVKPKIFTKGRRRSFLFKSAFRPVRACLAGFLVGLSYVHLCDGETRRVSVPNAPQRVPLLGNRKSVDAP